MQDAPWTAYRRRCARQPVCSRPPAADEKQVAPTSLLNAQNSPLALDIRYQGGSIHGSKFIRMSKDADLIIAPDEPSPGAAEVPVLEVFDGDGFLIRMKPTEFTDNLGDQSEIEVTARFGFVDAPELDQSGGSEAKAFLETLIGGRNVWINILTKSDTGRSVDRYGRIVCVSLSC